MLTNYSQFLRCYTSKFLIAKNSCYPRIKKQVITRNLKYTDLGLVEEDISALFNISTLVNKSNIGFSTNFLQIYTGTKDNILTPDILSTGSAWAVTSVQPNQRLISCLKKYSLRSRLLYSLRKLLRRDGVDFYLDQSSVILHWTFVSGIESPKPLEIYIRFFGFPLRLISLKNK